MDELVLTVQRKDFVKAEEITVKIDKIEEIVELKEKLVLAIRRKDFAKAEEIVVKIKNIEEDEANDLKNKGKKIFKSDLYKNLSISFFMKS